MKFFKQHLALIIILLFAFITRIYRLHIPEKYIFDEVYHVVTAKLIAANDPRAFEWWHGAIEPNTAIDWLHPPLAKYTQAFFIKILGSSSFSWRLSSALFGVGVIYLTYLLSQELFNNQSVNLLAAGLAALDGLLLVQSRLTMNDIQVTFFILLTLIFYLKFINDHQGTYLWLTGLTAGLAISSKWSGVFVMGIVGVTEIVRLSQGLRQKKIQRGDFFTQGLQRVFILGWLPLMIYLASYTPMFLQGKNLSYFYHLQQQIWWYQTQLSATHPYQSRPWQWFLDLRPVWIYVDYVDRDTIANIYDLGNPILFWAGGVSVIWTGIYLFYHRVEQKQKLFNHKLKWLLLAYCAVWLPWQFSPRIMFFYHYTPAVPLLCIILADWLNRLWSIKVGQNISWNRIATALLVFLIFANFIIWYPQWTAIPMPVNFVNAVYYIIPSWK